MLVLLKIWNAYTKLIICEVFKNLVPFNFELYSKFSMIENYASKDLCHPTKIKVSIL